MLSELRLQRELAAAVRLTKNNLHPYRLQVKELRYMLQMEKDPSDRALIEILGDVKDAIGEWHDWQELQTIARDHLHHASKCKLIPLLEKTTQQKLKRALADSKLGQEAQCNVRPLRPDAPRKNARIFRRCANAA